MAIEKLLPEENCFNLQTERGQEKKILQQGQGCCNLCLPLGHKKPINLSYLGLVRHGVQPSRDYSFGSDSTK